MIVLFSKDLLCAAMAQKLICNGSTTGTNGQNTSACKSSEVLVRDNSTTGKCVIDHTSDSNVIDSEVMADCDVPVTDSQNATVFVSESSEVLVRNDSVTGKYADDHISDIEMINSEMMAFNDSHSYTVFASRLVSCSNASTARYSQQNTSGKEIVFNVDLDLCTNDSEFVIVDVEDITRGTVDYPAAAKTAAL